MIYFGRGLKISNALWLYFSLNCTLYVVYQIEHSQLLCYTDLLLTFTSYVAPVSVSSLEQTPSMTFSLNCSSSGSPATSVVWKRDGNVVTLNISYVATQFLRNSERATFDNTLLVQLSIADILGNYTCVVQNKISPASSTTIDIEGQNIYLFMFTIFEAFEIM